MPAVRRTLRYTLRVYRLFLLAAAGVVAAASQDVQVRARFVPGDEFTLAMTRTLEERLGTERTYSISRTIEVRVASSSDEGTVLRWRPGPADLRGTPTAADARTAVAVLAIADHDFELELDDRGQVRRIRNVSELAQSLERARDAARSRVPAFEEPGPGPIRLPPLTAPWIAAAAEQDAGVFTGLYGLSHAVGEDLEVSESFPMPGGGVPGVRRFRIVSTTDDTIEATMNFSIDRDALRKQLPGAADLPAIQFDLTETARYLFDRRIGLHRSGKVEKVAVAGTDRRVERLEFSMTAVPKR
jgi:hypothetical protein